MVRVSLFHYHRHHLLDLTFASLVQSSRVLLLLKLEFASLLLIGSRHVRLGVFVTCLGVIQT